ncbi:hypothetical protein ACFW1A_30630 [Kitasatospora sp. NPDC058965]|uniref:hypothetical protein n=1 Tax=Kitasatospora sp. NPDC058965 TaxID=3346682 RepID=UPI0036A6E503
MSQTIGAARLQLGHRASVTKTEGIRSTTYHSHWRLYSLGLDRRPESGSVVLTTRCGHCGTQVRVEVDSDAAMAQKRSSRRTGGRLLVVLAVGLVVLACFLGANGAVPGIAGLFGLFGGFAVAGSAKTYLGASVARDQAAAVRNPHRIFAR